MNPKQKRIHMASETNPKEDGMDIHTADVKTAIDSLASTREEEKSRAEGQHDVKRFVNEDVNKIEASPKGGGQKGKIERVLGMKPLTFVIVMATVGIIGYLGIRYFKPKKGA